MKKYSLSSIFIIFVLFSQFAFAQVSFSSPIPGVWGNKQMLVIDGADNGDYYYSVDGSDPETFGFAYDGPVLLDIEGDVCLKVVHFSRDGKKEYGQVEYSVVTNDGFMKPYEDFLFKFLVNGYYDYNLEGGLQIPSSLTFTLEKNPQNFVPGMDLSIADDSVLTQFVPCTIFDSISDVKWRFFIKTGPQNAGVFGKRSVPFEISDWDTVSFISDDFIYRIDSEMWGQPDADKPVVIDRSVPHTISWQSVNYKIGNSIESVVLPPKPEIKYEIREDGSGCFYIEGDQSYSLSLISEKSDVQEYKSVSGGIGGVVSDGDEGDEAAGGDGAGYGDEAAGGDGAGYGDEAGGGDGSCSGEGDEAGGGSEVCDGDNNSPDKGGLSAGLAIFKGSGNVKNNNDGIIDNNENKGTDSYIFSDDMTFANSDYYSYEYKTEAASPELFSKIAVDAFYGDKISGELTLGVYSDAIYQGQVDVSYEVDKLPPKSPIISSSAKTFYSRNAVDLNISVDSDAELFVAVGDPFIIENTNIVYKPESPVFYSVPVSGYNNCENNVFNTTLEADDDKVVYYKILAYCQKGDMKSAIVEYSVIVDQSSYYFNKDAKDSLGEGTLLNPFTTFDQCINEFKDIRSVSLRVKGDLFIDKKYQLNSNLQIIDGGDARIIFGPSGSIELGGSSLEITGCRIHKIPSPDVTLIVPFFKLNYGTLDIKDCQISGDYSKNGTIIDAIESIVNISNSIISITADSYCSLVSSIDSKISLVDSKVSITADTAVIISASGGNINVKNNNLFIMGNIGRIAELFGVKGRFEKNEFKAELYNYSRSVEPIFASKNTILTEIENSEMGF